MSFGAAVTLVIASFIDSGTTTADFTRWSRSGQEGFLASASAFPIGNAIAMIVGGLVVALDATAVLGTVGIALAVASIWSYFEQWLNLLGVIAPPARAQPVPARPAGHRLDQRVRTCIADMPHLRTNPQ